MLRNFTSQLSSLRRLMHITGWNVWDSEHTSRGGPFHADVLLSIKIGHQLYNQGVFNGIVEYYTITNL